MKQFNIILMIAIFCYDEESSNKSYGRVVEVKNKKIASTLEKFKRVWITKREETIENDDDDDEDYYYDLGYLEQCSTLQFWDKQIGRVNVLAFLDSTWQFSHRQATLLRILKDRFERTGFRNVQFFAINAAPGESRFIERSEIEAEEETWRQISPVNDETEATTSRTPETLIEALGSDIYFIQDNEELQIWSKLRAFRDQILVIDRCGRLTFQVIVPWSILHFPYVKAAILSTYNDDPCGYCEFQDSFIDTNAATEESKDYNKITTRVTDSSLSPAQSSIYYESTQQTTTDDDNILTTNLPIVSTNYNLEESTIDTDHDLLTLETTDINDLTTEIDNFFITTNKISNTIPTTTDFMYSTIDFEETTINESTVENDNLETTSNDASKGIEKITDALDVTKLRSTNARSVSPNDVTKNNLENNSNEQSNNESSVINDTNYLLPIRIIMRAPHVDEYSDRTLKSHEYLVLKTGEPDYHDHLDNKNDDEPKKSAYKLGRIFGKDESPGIYGEVADYWRNFGNELGSTQINSYDDKIEENEEPKDDDKILKQAIVSQWIDRGKIKPEKEVAIELNNEKSEDYKVKEDGDLVDEEAKSKLIAHYSKLLPWLYYVLN